MLSVLESRLSTRACLSTLSSVASCPSPCVCLSPCFGSANPRLNAPSPYSLIRPSSRIHFSLHPSQTDVCPLTPHPSSAIDPRRRRMSADLAHINLAIVRRPSHPAQRHARPLTSHRHPDPYPARISAPILSADSALTAPTRLSPSAFVNSAPAMRFRLPASHSLAPDRDPQQGAKGCAAPPVGRCTSSWPYAIVQAPQKSPQASARAPPILRDPPMGAASPGRPPRPRARRRARWPPRARPPCL